MTTPTSGSSPAPDTSPQPVPSPELEKTAAALVDNGGAVQASQLEIRQCVVTAVNLAAATCSLAIGGDDAADAVPNVHYLSNYKPTVGDTAWALINGPDILALDRDGKFGSAAWAGMGQVVLAARESRSSTTYGDLATVGPQLSITIPASGRLLICVSAGIITPNSSGGAGSYMSFAIAGATTLAADDANALMNWTYGGSSHSHSFSGSGSGSVSGSCSGSTSGGQSFNGSISGSTNVTISGNTSSASPGSLNEMICSRVTLLTGLTPGAATVTAKYRVQNAAPGEWYSRAVWVLPL
jgi:hypothetical protein